MREQRLQLPRIVAGSRKGCQLAELAIFSVKISARSGIMAWNLPVIKAGCFTYRYEIGGLLTPFSWR